MGKSIFTINDLRIIWSEQNPDALKSSVKYFVDNGKLQRLRKGVYALPGDYNQFEAANKFISPSYISLETALQKHGILFQYTSAITSIAGYSRTIHIKNQTYIYHRVQPNILAHPLGIRIENHITTASPERAICDLIYIRGPSHFDNLRAIDPTMMRALSKIYGKKSVEAAITSLVKKL